MEEFSSAEFAPILISPLVILPLRNTVLSTNFSYSFLPS
ncbi:hypothetical protein THA_888 [Thermosipho africanus TCF52B]|uniref:Uncharacterized protein n=1 Tax=Thermosipho africanus (strain TCF52B) TaxID=484019 RepID=B7IGY3_THEAB|nr:hypothetical protein THA_888 [Thermosipho africanus TCF52B]